MRPLGSMNICLLTNMFLLFVFLQSHLAFVSTAPLPDYPRSKDTLIGRMRELREERAQMVAAEAGTDSDCPQASFVTQDDAPPRGGRRLGKAPMALSKKRWRLSTQGKGSGSIRLDEHAPRCHCLVVTDDKDLDDEGAMGSPELAAVRTPPRAPSPAATSTPPTRVSTSPTTTYTSPTAASTPSARVGTSPGAALTSPAAASTPPAAAGTPRAAASASPARVCASPSTVSAWATTAPSFLPRFNACPGVCTSSQ